jgi:peptidoglycan/LPS O-acetylase OafA/YrhL
MTDFGQSWSLCVEEQFYLVFPLAFFALSAGFPRALKWKWIWLLPMAISVVARARVLDELATLKLQGWNAFLYVEVHARLASLTHLDGLAVGVFLASTRDLWTRWSRRSRGAFALVGAAVAVAVLTGRPVTPTDSALLWYFAVLSCAFGALLVGCFGVGAPRRGEAVVRRIALWSYGAYLWNSLIVRPFEIGWHGSWWLGSILFFAVTFATAWVTYVGAELPGMRLRRPLLTWLGGNRDHFEAVPTAERRAVDPSSTT